MPERLRQVPSQESSGNGGRSSMPLFVFGGTIDVGKWYDFAACSSPIVEMVDPPGEERQLLADTYCYFCPVRDACLDSALTFGNPEGIWGGTTESDRKKLRRIPGFLDQLHESVLTGRAVQEEYLRKEPIALEEFNRVAENAKEQAKVIFESEQEKNYEAQEAHWINTFLDEDMTLGRSLMFMRLDLLLEKKQFAQKAKVHEKQLNRYEQNSIKPHQFELNKLINASRLRVMGLPAQMIRLMRENRSPMELSELQICSFGELFKYIRQLKGHSSRDAAASAGFDQKTIHNIEANRFGMKEETKKKILDYIDTEPESAISITARMKLEDSEAVIPNSILDRIISDENETYYLFAESLWNYKWRYNNISKPRRKHIMAEFNAKRQQLVQSGASPSEVLGGLLKFARERKGKSIETVALNCNTSVNNLDVIEKGPRFVPQVLKRAEILSAMGYRIHSTEMQYFIDFDQQAA